MLTYYGLDSAEIFLAARAATAHYGKNPPPPFQKDERPPGLLGAVEQLNNEALNCLNEANEASAHSSVKDELREITERVAVLKNSLATGKPLVAKVEQAAVPVAAPPAEKESPPPVAENEEVEEVAQVEEPEVGPIPHDRHYTQPRPHEPLQRGRLIVSCVSADNIMSGDSKLQPYLKMKMGNR